MRRAVLLVAALTLVAASVLVSPRVHALPSSSCLCSVDAPVQGGFWEQTGYPGQSCLQVWGQADANRGNYANNYCNQRGETLCSFSDTYPNYYCQCFDGGQCQVQMNYSFQCSVCGDGAN